MVTIESSALITLSAMIESSAKGIFLFREVQQRDDNLMGRERTIKFTLGKFYNYN